MSSNQPDVALYWLVDMLEAGEDPVYIAQRMAVFASKDIGMGYIVSVCTYNRPQNCNFCVLVV
jgi:replication-associated recombination protein RarA